MQQKQIIIHFICVLFGIFFVPLCFGYSANISVSPSQQTLKCGSSYDFYIHVNTSGERVVTSDIKFFLQGLSLSNFTALTGFDNVNYLGTNISTTGTNIGNTYHYINIYQSSFSRPVTGNDIPIAKITVTPLYGTTTGSFIFYNLSGNDEDSNIAVGIEYGTEGLPIKYNDFLSSTIDGSYTLTGCDIVTGTVRPGGGPILKKDNCKLPSELPGANKAGIDNSSSYYDKTCIGDSHALSTFCPIGTTKLTKEMTDAFQFAYGLSITTMCPVEKARLDGYILRKELAKVMTNFTIKIMGIYPNTSKSGCDTYDDISNESEEMKFYMKTICQLDMMGLQENGITPKTSFDPNQYVNRAQLGTILSRLVFGGKYNVTDTTIDTSHPDYRFKDHLSALKKNRIMNYISNPYMLELRGYTFIMLQRIYDGGMVQKYRLFSSAKNGSTVLLNN